MHQPVDQRHDAGGVREYLGPFGEGFMNRMFNEMPLASRFEHTKGYYE